MKAPELLLPAGGLECMRVVHDYGADAVYAGNPCYSLCARNNEFAKLGVPEQGIKEAHECNKKFFLTVNTLPYNPKLKTFIADMESLIAMRPDVLIMADPGLIMTVREKWPEVPIHLPVQANTTNYWGVKFWRNISVKRIVLSRELSMEEIAEIRQEYPDIKLEVFIRGTLCITCSGCRLLSGYFSHCGPNQGIYTNSCRWDYKVHNATKSDADDAQPLQGFNLEEAQKEANQDFEGINGQKCHSYVDRVFLVEESNCSDEMMLIMEDEHGTYIMNSKDLCGTGVVEKFAKVGVDSPKVEGRIRSLYYVARIAQSYRKAIDDAVAGRPFDHGLLSELEGLVSRGYVNGFLERRQTQDYQNHFSDHSTAKQSQYVGHVTEIDVEGWATVEIKNRFAVGDTLKIIHPEGNQTITLEQVTRKSAAVEVVPGNGIQAKIPNMQGREKALLARVIK